jgi:hypothetical protein
MAWTKRSLFPIPYRPARFLRVVEIVAGHFRPLQQD